MKRLAVVAIEVAFGAMLLAAVLTSMPALARAGTLVSCDFIQTREGARYVGTYCADFQCTYHIRRVFTSYCPFSI
jgi:Mn2+/Fe2+ NRAMP family transporter